MTSDMFSASLCRQYHHPGSFSFRQPYHQPGAARGTRTHICYLNVYRAEYWGNYLDTEAFMECGCRFAQKQIGYMFVFS